MNKKSFTLIEIIVTITILGIIMAPLGLMGLEYMKGIARSRDLGVAQNLAKLEMAKVNNLAYIDITLVDGYDNTTVNYEGFPYSLQRTVNYVAGSSNNLKQVQTRLYRGSDTSDLLAGLITYVASVSYGSGSGGGATGGGQSSSLVVSGGSISAKTLQNVTLQNSGASDITITGLIISFSGSGGIKFKSTTIDGSQRWSGTVNSGSTVTLDTSFTLIASTTYNNTALFTFSKNLSSVSSLVFIMSDATETSAYSW